MKVGNIRKLENSKYEVTLIPNWFERLLGIKPKIKYFKETFYTYTFGGGNLYIDEEGRQTKNGYYIAEEIDRFKRKINF